MRLFRKKTASNDSLLHLINTQFSDNSLLINYSIFGTKKLVPPLSKTLDYGVVSLVSILIYTLIVNKDLINY